MSLEIKTLGCKHSSQQRLFEDVSDEWVFDYPGKFGVVGNYRFENASFREINALFCSVYAVVADVYYHGEFLGRDQIGGATDIIFWFNLNGLEKTLEKVGKTKLCKHEKSWIQELFGDPLTRWANLRRRYNREESGIPEEIFVEPIDSHVLRAGLLNPSYFPIEENKTEVFATPYYTVSKKTFFDRFRDGAHSFVHSQYKDFRSGNIYFTLPRVKLNSNGISIPPNSHYAVEEIQNAFSSLISYALSTPTVRRGAQE